MVAVTKYELKNGFGVVVDNEKVDKLEVKMETLEEKNKMLEDTVEDLILSTME